MPPPENTPLLLPSSSNRRSGISNSIPYIRKVSVNGAKGTTLPLVVAIAIAVALLLVVTITAVIQPQGSGNLRTLVRQSAPEAVRGRQSSETRVLDIRSSQGRIRGYVRKSREGNDFVAFYKVPYARPPIGSSRFKDPEPPRKWFGLRDVPDVAPQCIQKEKYPTPPGAIYATGDEDCLYSNVYVPLGKSNSLPTTPTYPVMVYIHGGGTTGNGSRYGPEYFMDADDPVILITFQYRLGAFGTLSTGDDVIAGNMGFKDQVQMLRWVRENIADFGGDSGRVTVFGNSAGGINVGFLSVSPMARGLFHRGVQQSGGTACAAVDGQINLAPRRTMLEVGRLLNCPTGDSTEFLDCLNGKPASEIAVAISPETIFALVVDDKFMPDTPLNLLKSGKVNPVSLILGNTNAEWLGNVLSFLEDTELVRLLNQDFGEYGERVLPVKDVTSDDFLRVKEFYFGEAEIGNETMRQFIDMVSDKVLVHCSYVTAKLFAKAVVTSGSGGGGEGSGNVYLYWLTKPPAKSYTEKSHQNFPTAKLGLVAHADELQFQFPYYGYPWIPSEDLDHFHFSQFFVNLWTRFAVTGDPTLNGMSWPSFKQNGEVRWLEMNENPKTTQVPGERMKFWDQFSFKQLMYE